jgi:signal peptidase
MKAPQVKIHARNLPGWTMPGWLTRAPRRSTMRKGFSSALLVLAFLALAFAGVQVMTGQWHATPVLSGSMRPGMQPGDVVLTERVPIHDLLVRDVIVFHPPNEGDRLAVHRIVRLTVKGATTSITTWGDANPAADASVASLSGTTAYRVTRVVPLIGYPAVWLQNGGRGVLVIGLGVILLIAAAVTLLRPDKPAKIPGPADEANLDDPIEAGPDQGQDRSSARTGQANGGARPTL